MSTNGLDDTDAGRPEPWWVPYLVIVICAAIAGALILAYLLLNATEIVRFLRTTGLR